MARTTWERQHSTELDRLDTLDRHVDISQRLDHLAARDLHRGLERGLGIER